MPDYDSRIVDLYDGDNPDGADHHYYRALANRTCARSILDVGCGTGILTVTFADPGRRVVGMDPSHAMLEYARNRPGAERVTWIIGDTRSVTDGGFDLIVMTGNVAQHIPDPEWERTLSDLRALATPGATLAFESRNPATRAWKTWHQPQPAERDTLHGRLKEWSDIVDQGNGRILLRAHNKFLETGDYVLQEELLTFRTHETITNQLSNAGFETTSIWGDWHQHPFTGPEPIMIFESYAE